MGGRVLCARIILTAAGGFQNNLRCSRLRSLRSLTRLPSCFDEPTVLILQQNENKKNPSLRTSSFCFGWGGRVLCARIILTATGGLQNNLRCSRLRSLRSLMRLHSCFDEPTVLILQQNENKKNPSLRTSSFCFGWGGRIRTYECSSQSAVSYRLTTPQCELVLNLFKGFGRVFAKAFFCVRLFL